MHLTKQEIRKIIQEELKAVLTEEEAKKDACYKKIKAAVKSKGGKWPSAYASGRLVQCRDVGAANWKEGEPKKEGKQSSEDAGRLDKWFGRKGEKGKKGGWIDCNAPDGDGGYKECAQGDRKKKPYCRPTPSACKEEPQKNENKFRIAEIEEQGLEEKKKKPCKPSKGKRFAKRVDGKCRSFGQKGQAKGGGDRIRPGTKKGDAYCARSAKIKKCKNPPCANDLSRKKWKCRGSKSMREQNEETMSPYHDKLITLITSGEESLKQALELFSAIKGTGMLQPHEEDHIQRLSEYADVQYRYKSVVKEMSALRKEFGVASRTHGNWRKLARERAAALRSMRELEQNINRANINGS